jgi:hypothetical protein
LKKSRNIVTFKEEGDFLSALKEEIICGVLLIFGGEDRGDGTIKLIKQLIHPLP